jgi:tetratricopeptide (TPR) repeat protein
MNRALSPQQLEERIHQEKDINVKFVLLQQLADKTAEEAEKLAGTPEAEEKFEYAKQKYTQALQVARKMRDNKLECDILIDLGLTYENLQEINLAINSYEDAIRIAQKMQDFIVKAQIYDKLGALFGRMGEIDRGIEYLNLSAEAAEIAEYGEEEQTESIPFRLLPLPLRDSRQTTDIQKSIEVSDEVKELNRLRKMQQRRIIITNILLVIVFIILIENFSRGALSSIPFVIFGFIIIIAGAILTYLAFFHSFKDRLQE